MPTQRPVSMLIFPGAPSGVCIPNTLAIDLATGDLYDCKAGVWNVVGGGGGGGGDVTGPGSATDNAITRFDGTTGKLIQNSGITISDVATGTLAGTNSGDVTLAGENYLSIAAQVITANAINLSTTNVTNVLPATHGGTGQSTVTQGDLLYGSAANTWSNLAKDANATRYLANTGTSNNPAWNQINLSNGVTNRLPYANLTAATAASLLFGRRSASSGDWEEITLGANLSMSGTTLNTTGSGSNAPLYDFTITGSDQASIDTNVDGAGAGLLSGAFATLEIFFIGRTDEAVLLSNVDISFNNDGGANYNAAFIGSSTGGTTPAVAMNNGQVVVQGIVTGASAGANAPGFMTLTIPGYSGTTFYKAVRWESGATDPGTSGNTHRQIETGIDVWANTAAINRVKVSADVAGKKLKVGSRLIVYGR